MRLLIFLAASVPVLAIVAGEFSGTAFVLYREPKHVTAAILGWLLVVALVRSRKGSSERYALRAMVLREPALGLLGLFLLYLLTTGLWVRVPANHFYEANQYLLLFPLLLLLIEASWRSRPVLETLRWGLVWSVATVTAIGILQWWVVVPGLSPIDPEIGVAHPSMLGYKNPAALAVLGQLFLLTEMALDPRRTVRMRTVLTTVWLLEIAYLASLRSRTAYMAFAGATLFALVVFYKRGGRGQRRQATRLAALVVLLCSGVVVAQPAARHRLSTIVPYLSHPATFLDSDRGAYLRNTLVMVQDHPFGVGLGDWQTQYPLYRRYDRNRSFDERFEVRRAHSDHVQFLGEGGWPALALWVAFLVAFLWRIASQSDLRRAALHGGQFVAFGLAMATDYLLEMPYSKFQFFLVLGILLGSIPPKSSPDPTDRPLAPPTNRLRSTSLALLLLCLATAEIYYSVRLAERQILAAKIQAVYSDAESSTDLAPILDLAPSFIGGVGHDKAMYRTWLIVGETARRLGFPALARRATVRGAQLHPYSPTALRTMVRLTENHPTGAQWQALHDFVVEVATEGYDGRYPPFP